MARIIPQPLPARMPLLYCVIATLRGRRGDIRHDSPLACAGWQGTTLKGVLVEWLRDSWATEKLYLSGRRAVPPPPP